MRYTLRQLEVFLATARHQNISRAADTLAMSQSAASGALQDLERKFDVQLFDRIGKRLKINALGRSLQGRAEAMLEQARDLERSLAGGGDLGQIKVGATLTIGNYLTVRMIARFRDTFPQAEVALRVANTQAIAEQVANYDLDVGLIEGELRHADLEIIHWRDDELVVFAASGHPFTQLKALSDVHLAKIAWVVREPGSGTRQTFDRAMTGILSELDISLELQHTEAIKRAVEAHLGIGCLSQICLTEAFRRGTLIPLNVPHRNFRRHFSIIVHRQKYRSAGLKAWLDLCLSGK